MSIPSPIALAVVLTFSAVVDLPAQSRSSPLTRSDAVRIALERNPRIAAARAQWAAAKARRLVALAPEDPELEIELEELPGVFDTGQYGERSIGISQQVPFPLKWWFRHRAAAQDAESVRESVYEAARLAVEIDTKVAFDRVLADREIVTAREENLRLARDLAAKSQTRFEAGDVARLEAMRSEVEVGLSENGLARARADLAASEARLAATLGLEGPAPPEVTGTLTTDLPSFELEALRSRAVDRRPDLKGARQAVSRARSIRSGSLWGLAPDLRLGLARQTIGAPGARSSFWRASLGIEVPVWAPFRQRGEVSASSAEVRRAEAEYAGLKQRALAEVASIYAEFEAARNRVELFEAGLLKLAENTRQAAAESYRQGKATYLELLEAQKTLTETRTGYTEALHAYRRAGAELERAIGGSLP